MNYTNLEPSKKKIGKIIIRIILIFIIISITSCIIHIYTTTDKNNNNIRRKINIIEGDITNLYNYTETMSEFIVGDYILPEVKLNLILREENENLKKSFNEFKNDTSRIHLNLKEENENLKKSFNEFKNETLRIHLNLKEENENLKKSFNEFKNETFKSIENNRKRTEAFLKKKAIDFLASKYFITPSSYFHFDYPFISYDSNYNYKAFDENLEKNRQLYFDKMLEIDYDNFMVSFGYYSENLIYKLFNETIKFDYDYVNLKIKNENKYPPWLNYWYYLPYSPNSYFLPTQIEEQLPCKEWKGLSSKEFRRLTWWSDGIDGYVLNKILTKDEYINKIIRVLSVSPKIFI